MVEILKWARDFWDRLGQPWPLRAYLTAFGCALILPAILFAALGILSFGRSDRTAQNYAALEIARSIRNDIDRQLSGMITTLRALATSEALEQGDLASFYRQAKRALLDEDAYIVVRDPNKQQLLNTRVPWQTELPPSSEPPPPADRMARGEPWVSDLFVEPTGMAPLFSVNLPITLADGRKLILSMSVPTTVLLPIVGKVGLPASWEAGVADRQNRVLARSKSHQRFVGNIMSPEALKRTAEREGVWTSTNLDGENVLRAHATSHMAGWTVAAWVPLSVVEAPYMQSLRLLLLGGAALLTMSVLLAAAFARMMARPIGEISRAAAGLGRGMTPPPPSPYPLQEANAVAEALHLAGQQLRERQEASERHEKRIREAHERLTLALDVTGLGTWDRDLVTNKITWSEGMYRIFGRRHDQFHGTPDEVVSFVHPADRAAFRNSFEETLRGKSLEFGHEFRILHPDGETRWVLRRYQVFRSPEGRPLSVLGVALDITDRRDREDRISFLMRELAHRSKNLVAVIQAIAHQTARHSETISDFTERFSARLVSLARTQDLITARDGKGTALEHLVRMQTEPFTGGDAKRLSVSGPPVVLDDAATQSIGLALHELATNAAKYGALSMPRGHVAVRWDLATKADGPLVLKWRERNGPAVSPPTRKGFGHIVIERTLADSLQGEVKHEFAPDGVRWEAHIPPDRFAIVDGRVLRTAEAERGGEPADGPRP